MVNKLMSNNALSEEQLDNVSGGNYQEYVQISNAIAKRISEINNSKTDDKTERMTQEETANWLKKNLNIGVDFGISVSSRPLDFFNSAAKYYSTLSTTPGKTLTHAQVLEKIKNWKP
jgi:hypothetical protein